MAQISAFLRNWIDPSTGDEGLTYFCQGCNGAHAIKTKGEGAWGWNGDIEKPVFTPSVLSRGRTFTEKGEQDFNAWHAAGAPRPVPEFESHECVCHNFVGCNGAMPGQVIFLGDCTHAFAGQVCDLPEFPEHYG